MERRTFRLWCRPDTCEGEGKGKNITVKETTPAPLCLVISWGQSQYKDRGKRQKGSNWDRETGPPQQETEGCIFMAMHTKARAGPPSQLFQYSLHVALMHFPFHMHHLVSALQLELKWSDPAPSASEATKELRTDYWAQTRHTDWESLGWAQDSAVPAGDTRVVCMPEPLVYS